jgi:hypothetical protein
MIDVYGNPYINGPCAPFLAEMSLPPINPQNGPPDTSRQVSKNIKSIIPSSVGGNNILTSLIFSSLAFSSTLENDTKNMSRSARHSQST